MVLLQEPASARALGVVLDGMSKAYSVALAKWSSVKGHPDLPTCGH